MYQKLIIIGNLGRDPEMRYTPDGKAVTTFSVAASRRYGEKEETAWFRVSVWGKQAESCNQYLQKGSKVLVEGRLTAEQRGRLILPNHALHARALRFDWRNRAIEFSCEPEHWFMEFAAT